MFGKELIMDLKDCNAEIFNEVDIEQYIVELCKLIDMERVGNPLFWQYDGEHEHLKGLSVMQFIKTSSIVIHTSDLDSRIYMDIFSCKDFDESKVLEFTEKWFEGVVAYYELLFRGKGE